MNTNSSFEPSKALKKYKDEVAEYPSLDDHQTRALFRKRATSRNEQEKRDLSEQIMQGYLSYVITVAESFLDVELLLVDYIQEGNIALLQSMDDFEYEGKESFLDFCTPRIQEAIREFIKEHPLPKNVMQFVPSEKPKP